MIFRRTRKAVALREGDKVIDELGNDWSVTHRSLFRGEMRVVVRRSTPPHRTDVWRLPPSERVRVRR